MHRVPIQNVYTLPANDGTDRTIRDANLQDLKHAYAVGDAVRVMNHETRYINSCYRDCDGEPLYSLSLLHPDDRALKERQIMALFIQAGNESFTEGHLKLVNDAMLLSFGFTNQQLELL